MSFENNVYGENNKGDPLKGLVQGLIEAMDQAPLEEETVYDFETYRDAFNALFEQATSTLEAIAHTESQEDHINQTDFLKNSVISFFGSTQNRSGEPLESPLARVAAVLQRQGISPTHLREALAALIGISSAHLGDPTPIVITEDEGAGAAHLLDACLNLAPESFWVGCHSSDIKIIAQDPKLRGKTLISYDADSVRGQLSEILWMTERAATNSSWRGIKTANTEGPVSFVAIARTPGNPVLQNPYATRIHLSADKTSKAQLLDSMSTGCSVASRCIKDIERACARTFLSRVRRCPVDISYSPRILGGLNLNVQNIVPVYDLTLRMIRNVTRINNPPPFLPSEPLASFIGINFDTIRQPSGSNGGNLVSTKIDYYYFKKVFDGFLQNQHDFMTPRQSRVFDAILFHNMAHLRRFRYKTPELDILKKIVEPIHKSCLADRQVIWEAVKSDGGEQLSASTLNSALQELLKRDIIFRDRLPRKSIKYGYGIKQLGDTSLVAMPNPSDIVDPTLRGRKVKIRNPFTGDIEEI